MKASPPAPELPPQLPWLNVDAPLSLLGLRGKIVLLHFWTARSVNCLHLLRELGLLEEEFPQELALIGVHCGKYPAESDFETVRQAVIRHNIRHPITVDSGYLVWRAYRAKAWPTLVVIDAAGGIIGAHPGEVTARSLRPLIKNLANQAREEGLLRPGRLTTRPEFDRQPQRQLLFPSSVIVTDGGRRLVVSDSGQHRILIIDRSSGRIIRTAGGQRGYGDGSLASARFFDPACLCLVRDRIVVADRGNHAIRLIDLAEGLVSTVAGGPSAGEGEVDARSPEGILAVDGFLYVSESGRHRLQRYDLQSGAETTVAGDCFEGLLDGAAGSARLAQPSGMAFLNGRIWWLDSETSSLRSLHLQQGIVSTHVGRGLFEWGCVDGGPSESRMQHPTGIAATAKGLLIADTYNNRIRHFNPETETLITLAGSGEAGLYDAAFEEACFWQPEGICFDEGRIWVADSANHAIRMLDPTSGEVETFEVRG